MKKRRIVKIKFKRMEPTFYIGTDGWWFQSCCSCKSRHIWHLTVHRGKTPDKDFIEINGTGDEIGSKLRRFYDKYQKQ